MHVVYRVLQYARPPYLAGPCRFEDTVARRVAFNSDHVEPGARVLDREIQTEGAAIVRVGRLPSLAAEESSTASLNPSRSVVPALRSDACSVTKRPSSARP